MRCFMVDETRVVEGLAVTATPHPHVGVGEEGRGREYSRFPISSRFAEGLAENARVERASVMRTSEGSLLLVEERDPRDQRAIVLADIAAGFRGDSSYWSTTTVLRPCAYRGRDCRFLSNNRGGVCRLCGEKLVQEEGQLIHPDAGERWVYDDTFPSEGITALAQGYRAQGEAGRMGGHPVYLLLMEPGASFRVFRSGRLYGEPAERVVNWTGENLLLGTMDEVFPPLEEEGGTLI